MRRFVLLLAALITAASFGGCGPSLEPKPLTSEEEREYLKRLEELRASEMVEPPATEKPQK
jgi:hypothetical protein